MTLLHALVLAASLRPDLPPAAARYAAQMGAPASLPAVAPVRVTRELHFLAEVGRSVSVVSEKTEDDSSELPTIPLTSEDFLDGATLTSRDTNGNVSKPTGRALAMARLDHEIASGRWLLDGAVLAPLAPDAKGRDGVQVSLADVPTARVELRFDARGDLVESVDFYGTNEVNRVGYEDFVVVAGRRVARKVSTRKPIFVEPSVEMLISLEPLSTTPPAPVFSPPNDVHFPPGARTVELPLTRMKGYLELPVSVNGQPAIFLVDSGASGTVLDLDSARRLGITPRGSTTMTGGAFKKLQFLRTPELNIGGVRLDPQTVLGFDLSHGLMGEWVPGIAGILGVDFWNRVVVEVDYAAGRMRFHPRGGFVPRPDDVLIESSLDGSEITASVKVNGQPAHFQIDTGNPGGIEVHHVAGQRSWVSKGAEDLYDPEGMQYGSSSAGAWPAYVDLAVGPFTWPHAPAQIADASSAKGDMHSDGNLGNEFLSKFRMTVDFTAGKLWLAQQQPLPRRGAGTFALRTEHADGGLRVVWVAAKGPAGRAGLVRGDVIDSINDFAIRPGSTFATSVINDCQPGDHLVVGFKRGGGEHRAEFNALLVP